MKQKMDDLTAIIQEYERRRKTETLSKEEYDTYIQTLDEREEVRKIVEHLENDEDELEYLVNTGSILFKYYDIMEKGTGDEATPKPKITSNSILKYFLKPEDTPKEDGKEKEEVQDRATLLDSYMSYVDENYVRNLPSEVSECCENCGSTNRNIMLNDGIAYCNDCSCVEYIIVDHDRPSYKDPPREVSYFAYKRKRIDALKSHMPKISELCLWENICVLRLVALLTHQWLVLLQAVQHTLLREVPKSLQYHSTMETWMRNTVNYRPQW